MSTHSLTCYSERDESLGVGLGMNVFVWPPKSVTLASVTFHWPLTHVSKLLDENCVSDRFAAAGFHWVLKFCARAVKNKPDGELFASFFVMNVEAAESNGPHATFELGIYSQHANDLFLVIGVINQDFPEQTLWRPCQHIFTNKVQDWGFARFIALEDLVDPKRGFVVNDRLVLAIRF